VIVGNPPYSVGQDDTGENNQNLSYPKLDGRIAASYAAHSSSTNKNSLYDSYIRAFRWAADRVKDEGIVCFVTNGGWIDGNTMDGFRKTLQDEFSDVYVFNLRGNARTQGELRKKEAGNVFDAGSRTPVAVTLLVKRKGHDGRATIRYHDIGDYLTREQKLDIISGFGSHQSVPWQTIEPNEHHDWINQRSGDFGSFVPLNDANDAVFLLRSSGVQTNRDNWAYNASPSVLADNMEKMIDFYNHQLALHRGAIQSASSFKDRRKWPVS
jgi:predicted helicase